jgi:hypothetical protein
MRDFARLRSHLRAALAVAPLLAGCHKHPRNLPSCPSGNWCGPAADVKALAQPDSHEVLGCTNGLHASSEETQLPKDWPGNKRQISMYLDEGETKKRREAHDDATCCYHWIEPCPGGRALVVEGRATRAEPVWGAMLADDVLAGMDPALRARLADAWLADALAEHASIASFARATIELIAVGAPNELLEDAARAMRDEIRHAERCFELASRFAGRAVSPGPLAAAAPRTPELAQLAVDTFIEGCVGETVSALAATRALAGCEDDRVARVLRGIVADETRHAALAWKTIAWTIAEGGAPVVAALRACAQVPAERTGERDTRLAAHGRLDGEAALRAERDAWLEIILPTLEELCAHDSRSRYS